MIQFQFDHLEPEQQEILIAHLAEIGFSGFEEADDELYAYINEEELDRFLLHEICYKYGYRYKETKMEQKNWNQLWESNFQPIRIDNFVGIRADFHPRFDNVEIELKVTPKMSFGTGHHATTWLMISAMRSLNLKGSKVLDFGTGTGVLAILAEKMGAERVLALDNDEWSISNSRENVLENGCSRIEVKLCSSLNGIEEKFDIILANINRNVILDNLAHLKGISKENSVVLLSGLLQSDEAEMEKALEQHSLSVSGRGERAGWIFLECRFSVF